jgi:thiol:disulfide interchange protein
MKAITWLASFTVGITALSASAFASTPKGWSTDLEKAIQDAKNQHKSILVEFTGSDWCPPCIAMRKNVFTKEQFVTEASKKFILVELDFPKGSPEIAAKNEPFAKKFQIDGFPTVILLDENGKEFQRFYASAHPTIEAFLEHLSKAKP